MTARDSSLYARQAIVTALAGLAAAVYGPAVEAKPVWPFVRVAIDDAAPVNAACLRGSALSISVHCFAKGADEREVTSLMREVIDTLDGVPRALAEAPYPASLRRVLWLRSQVIRDTDEAESWHGIVNFAATVSS